MRHWINTTGKYLRTNSAWFLVVVILAAAFVIAQMTGEATLMHFLRPAAGLLILFSPWLIFMFYRDYLGATSGQWAGTRAWPLVFMTWYLAILWLFISVSDLPFCRDLLREGSVLEFYGNAAVGALLILVEGWVRFGKDRQWSMASWLSTSRLRWIGIVVLVAFSVLLIISNNPFQAGLKDQSSIVGQVLFFSRVLLQVLIAYGSYYVLFYLHKHLLYDQMLLRKGWVHYVLGGVLVLLVLIPIYSLLIGLLPDVTDLLLHPVGANDNLFSDVHFALGIGVFLISLPLNAWQEWYQRQQRITELEKERFSSELSLLKQQINPHFFFNTLNNLYAMSITQDEAAPETILQLSELMRYVIYQGPKDLVPLAEEIKYLEDYLELQQIRIHQKVDIRFAREIVDGQQLVPPLLFIILLENALKHGVEPAPENAFLHLRLEATEKEILFNCSNSVDPEYVQEQPPGIGLQNLRRRLELRFPERHELAIQSTPTTYTASLKLNIENIAS